MIALWIVGSIIKNPRVTLAKRPAELVSTDLSSRIDNGRLRTDQERMKNAGVSAASSDGRAMARGGRRI